MTIRAAMIDDESLVINLIVVGSSDLSDKIIAIPTNVWSDGSVLFLPVMIGSTRWTGTEFVDLDGVPLAFDEPTTEIVGEPQ
jgi:hypothetical protein